MQATAIPRLSFESLTLTDSRTQLAKDAKAKLGYKKLAQAIAMPGALLYQLRLLDIQPLVTGRVSDYQRSKKHVGAWSGTIKSAFAAICALLALGSFVYGMMAEGRLGYETKWLPIHYALNVCALALTVLCFLRTFGAWGTKFGHGRRVVRDWFKSSLEDFTGNVPEFALAKAIQIKEALPKAKFDIEYLAYAEQNNPNPAPLPDPFLVATLDDERYYIEVWDEKEYEKHL